jgi:hypothetical protein
MMTTFETFYLAMAVSAATIFGVTLFWASLRAG